MNRPSSKRSFELFFQLRSVTSPLWLVSMLSLAACGGDIQPPSKPQSDEAAPQTEPSSLRTETAQSSNTPAASQRVAALPETMQGKYPIHMPAYDGVDQLLLLSSQWLVVVTTNLEEVLQNINDLSGGSFFENVKSWEDSQKQGRSNWNAYHGIQKIRDQYIAKAREMAGERRLGDPSYFTVTSPDDPAYDPGRSPGRATRSLVSLDEAQVQGGAVGHDIHYAHYSYLQLPEPMKNGSHYTITLKNGGKVTFLYDEMRTVSRAIKVNQIGYLPGASRKFAYLGAYLQKFGPLDFSEANRFEVISVTSGETVYQGDVKLREKNPRFAPRKPNENPAERPLMYGEDVYELDLSGLKDEGTFFIRVPGVGRSWPFRHAPDIYGQAFYLACRALFHQRCGTGLEENCTSWHHGPCHTEPVYESDHIFFPPHDPHSPKNYSRFDVIAGSIDRTRKTEQVVGGWHDAADWDRNAHHFACVFDLLCAFEFAPEKFTDGQLNIPESGNGIPDILDEAEFGLRVWKQSMDERGGVSGMVETWTHPSIDGDVDYAFSQRTRWNSLIYAAAAAQWAHLAKPFSEEKSNAYAASAKKAYDFGVDPANSLGNVTLNAEKNRGRGKPYTVEWEEKESDIWPYQLHAQIRLRILTEEPVYLDGLANLLNKAHPPFEHHFSYKDFSAWIYQGIACAAPDLFPKELVEKTRRFYLKEAENRAGLVDANPYRQTWPRDRDFWLGWGNSDMTNLNRPLWLGYQLTADPAFRDAMLLNTDFMLGANPMGMSWTTGLGWVYPVALQHGPSNHDDIVDPVPGITIYGITGGPIYHKFRQLVWQSPSPEGPVDFIDPENTDLPLWRRWMAHPRFNVAQCEFTVHETMASTIFTFAMLMPENWMPDEELKNRLPRQEEVLFGRYYLP